MNRDEIRMIYKAVCNCESNFSADLSDTSTMDNAFEDYLNESKISQNEKDTLQKIYKDSAFENHENGFIDGFSYACHLFM